MFLLPLSLLYDIYHAIRSYVVFQLNTAPSQHVEKVRNVQQQVQAGNYENTRSPNVTSHNSK